jgi:hypothetical protein
MDKEESFCNSTCEDQINMAERELSAFIRAVAELFGPEQARFRLPKHIEWRNHHETLHILLGCSCNNGRPCPPSLPLPAATRMGNPPPTLPKSLTGTATGSGFPRPMKQATSTV